MHFSSVVASRHLVTDASFTINLVRGMTRLRQLCWVPIENGAKKAYAFKGPGNGTYTAANDHYTWMVTIGSRKWPERPCTGVAQTFRSLRQACGAFYGTDDLALTPLTYNADHFISGVDLEKAGNHGATHTGQSTKNGDIVQLSVQNSPLTSGGSVIVFMVFDGLLSIRDGTVDVFE